MTIALIDGDLLAYKAASAAEQATNWGGASSDDDSCLWTLHADESDGVEILDRMLDEIAEAVRAETVLIALSHAQNFRKEIDASYKANRSGQRKPLILRAMRRYLIEEHDAETQRWLEADDLIGLMATQMRKPAVIVSWDKDLQQIPGDHYNPENKTRFTVSQEQAERFLWTQIIAGDSTDGYPGVPGMGPKRAAEFLEAPYFTYEGEDGKWRKRLVSTINTDEPQWAGMLPTRWECLVSLFEKAGQTDEDALRQARLARILKRPQAFDADGFPVLWEPWRDIEQQTRSAAA